ncbi:MAG: hypothetical protein KatS3mg084_0354 [Candidatus Dojkabacteria bacterium]|jgi:coenzyme F420-reducing hydrogenase beta subunit|nr:MAG: hypothetical protein KatS3mg084_0354 [Candidatus Dojkabacteria bacterium]
MLVKIKVITSNNNEWLGWFGDNVLKLKLNCSKNLMKEALLQYLYEDLGIKQENIKFISVSKNIFTLDLPDVAWELFLTIVK